MTSFRRYLKSRHVRMQESSAAKLKQYRQTYQRASPMPNQNNMTAHDEDTSDRTLLKVPDPESLGTTMWPPLPASSMECLASATLPVTVSQMPVDPMICPLRSKAAARTYFRFVWPRGMVVSKPARGTCANVLVSESRLSFLLLAICAVVVSYCSAR
jgi:hypothetical protein